MQHDKIYQLFSNRYNQSTWKEFLGLSFANTRLLTTPLSLTVDNAIALSVQNLGNIILDEDGVERQIAVFDVTLAKGIILEKNRVGLRNLLRKYWKDIDAAFIVYHLEGMPNWRFTFVSELTGYNDEGEFIKITTEPKRFTYILGEGESTRTAVERFAHLFKKTAQISLNDIKEAFSVEKLSKSFFDAYKKHYDTLCTHLSSEITINNGIFKGDDKAIRDFSKKFLGRIVFLYFIQKKGWLGVPPKEKYGKGDTKFLQNQFDNFRNKDLFYKEFLTILFFETLNKYRNDDIFNYDNQQFLTPHSQVKIPFLSGGLFDEDDVKQREINIPSNVMRNIFDFFNQYNFTIYEDSPDDHTVAVDPEMLGHIFENLLEDNKDKGAFYTPREIVHYMCQESIIEYLCTTLSVGEDASKRKAIEELFKLKEVNPILQLELKKLNKALDSLKICDPAIGSGAFPMGLLHEIFTAKQTLHLFEYGNTLKFDASAVKQNIIQNSIYGVDIEKGAVDIARLRFWLSLVVDEDEPRALPNLDYKIVHGNSLVSKFDDEIVDIDWNPKGSVGKADVYLNNLKIALATLSEKQKEYFSAALKADLKAEIRNLKLDILINQLSFNQALYQNRNQIKFDSGLGLKPAEVKSNAIISEQLDKFEQLIKKCQHLKEHPDLPFNFFDWKLDFPEVMNEQVVENVGFDIVIGNPPYGAKLTKTEKDYFKELFSNVHMRTPDTFNYFISKSFKLLLDNGTLTLIVPNNLLFQNENTKTRSLLINNNILKRVVNLGDNTFENADVPTCIFISVKTKKTEYFISYSDNRKERIHTIDFYKAQKQLFNIEVNDVPDYVIGVSTSGVKIMKDIKAISWKIDDIALEVASGISTGSDKVFRISKDFIEQNNLENDILKPVLVGGEIDKYKISNTNHFVIYTSRDTTMLKYPVIEDYLKEFKSKLQTRSEAMAGIMPWYSLNRQRYPLLFIDEKIIMRQTSDSIRATIDINGFYCIDSILVLKINPLFNLSYKYVLILLNSKMNHLIYKNLTQEEGRVFAQVKPQNVRKLFIPKISIEEQKVFEVLCDYLLFLNNSENQIVNQQIGNKELSQFFQQIADACVVELIYGREMEIKNVNILEFVRKEISSFENLDLETNQAREIQKAYQKWTLPNSEVHKRLKFISLKCPDTAGKILNANDDN